MTTVSIPHTHPSFPLENAILHVKEKLKHKFSVLKKHTDLVSSLSILAITTGLLAAKIFKSIPPILPRLGMVIFNYGGIIWLNVQVTDLVKSCRDLERAISLRQWLPLLETVLKVFVKGVAILLTCVTFTASLVALFGAPHISLAMQMAMRPIGLTSLVLTIMGDIRDYFTNKTLIKELDRISDETFASGKIAKIMISFFEIILPTKQRQKKMEKTEEVRLADRLVRQMDTFTIQSFREGIKQKRQSEGPRLEAIKLFEAAKTGLQNKQALTKSNLSLTALGYASMGICRAFPDTLLEMSTRWGMSVLYTDELIRQKLYQADLEKNLRK